MQVFMKEVVEFSPFHGAVQRHRLAFGIRPAALDAGRLAGRGYVFHAFWRRGDSLATGRAARKSPALGGPHFAAVKIGDRLRFSQFQMNGWLKLRALVAQVLLCRI
jgi:hypothetical protein